MRIALGMITKNERPILEKTLPHKTFSFDDRIVLDFYSDDYTVELCGTFGFQISSTIWNGDFSQARNILIGLAEHAGFDYLFMLDADEAMFASDIEKLKVLAEAGTVLALPRIEFVQDFGHYDPDLYPDYQCRFFPLNQGYHFKNKVHEMLYDKNGNVVLGNSELHLKVPETPIYHYSRVKDHRVMALKYINYDRMVKGEEPLAALPEGYDPAAKYWGKSVVFTGKHPLEKINQ